MMFKEAKKLVGKTLDDKMAAGEIPRYLGVPGMLALMHENIRRFFESGDSDELLDLAAHSLCAVECFLRSSVERMGEPPGNEPTDDEEPVSDEEPYEEEDDGSGRWSDVGRAPSPKRPEPTEPGEPETMHAVP